MIDDINPLPDHNPPFCVDPAREGRTATTGKRRATTPGRGKKRSNGYSKVNQDFLQNRAAFAKRNNYPKPRYVEFCEAMLSRGFECWLHEARKTHSKYVSVRYRGRRFRVRFSNHKPVKARELAQDCDFFVGRTHTGVRTTEDAIEATIAALAGANG